jgi:hypothetical protein
VTCDYFPWAGENADPADISRAVARLLAVPQDKPAGDHLDTHPEITLKGAVCCAMRARGLLAELQMSVDEVDFSVYADIAITNPEQPGRGIVCVTDEGSIWWECYVNEITGRAREIVMTLTDMLVPFRQAMTVTPRRLGAGAYRATRPAHCRFRPCEPRAWYHSVQGPCPRVPSVWVPAV